jgi:hypothetical protein
VVTGPEREVEVIKDHQAVVAIAVGVREALHRDPEPRGLGENAH